MLLGGCLIKEQAGSAASGGSEDANGSTGDELGAAASSSATTAPPGDPNTGPEESMDESSTGGPEPEDVTTSGPASDGTATTSGAGVTFVGDCCEPQRTPGCDDETVTTCVCALDSYCCDNSWDALCVDLMVDAGCHVCGADTMPTNGDGPGNCCAAGLAKGCLDDAVRTCVCGVDAFCCEVQWDQTCVEQVDGTGCGTCMVPGPACCASSQDPGCAQDPMIEACVCAQDAFCCSSSWDNLCVDEVVQFGCGDCTPPPPGDCCEVTGAPGCTDPTVEACVCAADAFCCSNTWDQICVDEVDSLGCGACPGFAASGGMDTGFDPGGSTGYSPGTSGTG